jgi:hypothetical protein
MQAHRCRIPQGQFEPLSAGPPIPKTGQADSLHPLEKPMAQAWGASAARTAWAAWAARAGSHKNPDAHQDGNHKQGETRGRKVIGHDPQAAL